jgi:predicted AAA+ superfamily ATPase
MIHRPIFDEVGRFVDAPEAIIVTGMRRTGKTTLLRFLYDRMEGRNKLFLDLENPLNRRYFETENYEGIKLTLGVLGIDFAKRAHIFLDEIQFVRNLPSIIKYFIDTYGAKFFLTGSASFYLKHLFTESLTGRKYVFELHPLNFTEFLTFKGLPYRLPDDPATVTREIYDLFAPLYDEYLLFGGFPGVVQKGSGDEKSMALHDIFTSFFQLEVMQLGDFRRNDVVRDLMVLLMQRIGSRMDVNKLSRELGVSRHTIHEYVSFLEGTYFIRIIRPFSTGRDTELRKMPKVYLCDTGLANQFARLDTGPLFENSVFLSLAVRGDVAYYQKKSGVEVDFILNREHAFEVKVNPEERDMRRLQEIAGTLGLARYSVAAKKYSQLPNVTYGFMM